MINFLNLKYFLVLTEEMNFHKAADKLYISQQSLSGHIRKLENYFNVSLFNRMSTLTLTPEGKHLKEKAKLLLSIENDLRKKLIDINGEICGTLNIGSTHERSSVLLPPIIRSFHEKFPDVTVNLFEGNTPEIRKALLNRKIDLCIGYNQKNNKEITDILLYKERFLIIIPNSIIKLYCPSINIKENFSLTKSITLSCLKKCPFISIEEGTKQHKFNEMYFLNLGIKPKILIKVKNVSTMLSFCSNELGFIICPETFFKFSNYEFLNHSIFAIKENFENNNIVISYKNTPYKSRNRELFINTAKNLLYKYLE